MTTKDPAFLFYWQDFAYGTRMMTFEERGAYILLLCEQADVGHMSLEHIKMVLNNHFNLWDKLSKKFITDDAGLFYNKVLESHMGKRRKWIDSRRKNLGAHMEPPYGKDSHMENVNVNVNENVNNKETKEEQYKIQAIFESLWLKYPNKDGKKLAFTRFMSSVKTQADIENIKKALDNYLSSKRVSDGYVKNGSTWFNNWQDWIENKEVKGEFDDYFKPDMGKSKGFKSSN